MLRSLLFVVACTLVGCAPATLYYWGSYDSAVAALYAEGGPVEIGALIEALGTELETTPLQKIPPGKAATLGYLYTMLGNETTARRYFRLEQQLFPESAPLVKNFLLKKGSQ